MSGRSNTRQTTLKLTITALFMAMVIALSSFGIPVPGGHLYLNDTVIVLAAMLLDPFLAFMAGGVGAFLGDMLFYPAPMFVSLAVHGLQAVIISVFSHNIMKSKPKAAAMTGIIIGALVMVLGYTLGRAFVYANPEYAIIKLPFQFLQAGLGVVIGPILCWKCGIKKMYDKAMLK